MSTTAVPAPGDEARMSLMEHLTELRDRLIKVAIGVAIGMVLAFVFYNPIFDFLVEPYVDSSSAKNSIVPGKLIQSEPLEGFNLRMRLALYGGISFAMPVILWQLWRFVTPGLYPHEKRYAVPFLVSAMTLFVLGAGLAYYTLPQALDFLNSIGGDNLVTGYQPGKYNQLIVYMMLAFGVGFEFPILLIFLQMARIVNARQLLGAARYAIVGICVLVAVITPSGDPISMMMLAAPMVVFYFGSIVIGLVLDRRKAPATG